MLGRASIHAHEKENARLHDAESVGRVRNSQGLLLVRQE